MNYQLGLLLVGECIFLSPADDLVRDDPEDFLVAKNIGEFIPAGSVGRNHVCNSYILSSLYSMCACWLVTPNGNPGKSCCAEKTHTYSKAARTIKGMADWGHGVACINGYWNEICAMKQRSYESEVEMSDQLLMSSFLVTKPESAWLIFAFVAKFIHIPILFSVWSPFLVG